MAMMNRSMMVTFGFLIVGIVILAVGAALEAGSHDATTKCLTQFTSPVCNDAGQSLIALGLALFTIGIGFLLVWAPDEMMMRG